MGCEGGVEVTRKVGLPSESTTLTGVIQMADTKMDKKGADGGRGSAELSRENRRALKRLREHVATPLTEEDREYWREFRAFVEAHPFTFRGEQKP